MMNNAQMNAEELNLNALEDVTGGKDAGQKIKTTGNANVRKGPGLNYAALGTVSSGTKLTFLGIAKKDDRGVAWYKVKFNGATGWISSKYAKIV